MTGINILPENTEKKKTHTQMKRCSPLYAIKEMQNNHSEVSLQIYKITKIKKRYHQVPLLEDVQKLHPSNNGGENIKWCSYSGNNVAVS